MSSAGRRGYVGQRVVCNAIGLVVSAVCLIACTTPASTPQPVVPQWVYTGPAIVLKRPDRASASANANANDDDDATHVEHHAAVGDESEFQDSVDAVLRDPVSAADALRFFNAKRAEVGLPPMRDDADVRDAAVAHARYLQTNHAFGHVEMVGAPDFAGTDVTARIRRQRAVAGASEVVSMQSNDRPESEAIAQLFASPYHRGVILFDWLSAGAAVSHDAADVRAGAQTSIPAPQATTELAVVDFADFGQAIASNELIAYPFDGQSDAPVAWTDDELPDPMGDDAGYRGRVVGYPMTLSGGPNAHIVLQRVDLKDSAGRTIRCHIAALTVADSLRNTAVCTPLDPLRAQTRYTVHALGTLTEGRYIVDVPFDLTWQFRTGG